LTYQIDRPALTKFVLSQASLVETTPFPSELDAPFDPDELTLDDVRAIWLGVGISTQIGRTLLDAPERFVTDRPALPATMFAGRDLR
jgi:hypothetical protein